MRCSFVHSVLSLTVAVLAILTLASCSPDVPPTSESTDARVSNPVEPVRTAPAAPGSQARTLAASPAAPVAYQAPIAPPKDAQWTLMVYSERGPSHVADANTLKDNLIQKTGRRDWYVIHSGDESNIYLGYYRTFDDPRDPATTRAQADLKLVKTIELIDTDGQPQRPFERAAFVSVAAPDPLAPPEWNLFNKDRDKNPKDPTRAFWSLQIMAFRGIPDRKEKALQAATFLRKQGVEAYYFHGDTISSVCVGAWPMNAIEQQVGDGNHTFADESKTLVVYGSGVTAKDIGKLPETDDQGHKIVAVTPVVNVLDDSLRATMKKWNWHAVNDWIGQKKGVDGKLYDNPSFLVEIPRAAGNGFYDSDEVAPTPGDLAATPDSSDPTMHHVGLLSTDRVPVKGGVGSVSADPTPSVPAPGAGHLRRLGDN